jgi:predicted transcriptional regulator
LTPDDEGLSDYHIWHMARSVQKTTVYLDAEDYRRLKALPRARKQTPAHLLREAVAEYTAKQRPRRRARSVGAGESGRNDLSERAEDLLGGFGRRR